MADNKGYIEEMMEQITSLIGSQDPYEQLILEYYQMFMGRMTRVKNAINEKKHTAALGGNCVPELLVAMDIEHFQFLEFPFADALVAGGMEGLYNTLDKATEALGPHVCSFVRIAGWAVEAGVAPFPTVVIGMSSICEAGSAAQQLVGNHKDWKDVPAMSLESPARMDEKSYKYIAQQLHELVKFLEKHTGNKLDIDRLKEICVISNEQLKLWWEYNELRRSVPCPSNWKVANMINQVARYWGIGKPESTEWLKKMVSALEQRVKEGRGIDGIDEKIRVFWFDFPPIIWGEKLFKQLGEEYGVVMVMDLYSDNPPHTMIDISNDEKMWMGLGKRATYDFGMPRIALGSADLYRKDTIRVVKDFNVDLVIWPGHIGHKDAGALVNLVEEQCRQLGVHFLNLGCDLLDDRVVTVDEMKKKIVNFLEAKGLV